MAPMPAIIATNIKGAGNGIIPLTVNFLSNVEVLSHLPGGAASTAG